MFIFKFSWVLGGRLFPGTFSFLMERLLGQSSPLALSQVLIVVLHRKRLRNDTKRAHSGRDVEVGMALSLTRCLVVQLANLTLKSAGSCHGFSRPWDSCGQLGKGS